MKAIIQKAIDCYLSAQAGVGGSVISPSATLSTVSRNGTVFLRNVNGPLAVVTSSGKVFTRIGGVRLDTSETGGAV
jgi:hypothetical protein